MSRLDRINTALDFMNSMTPERIRGAANFRFRSMMMKEIMKVGIPRATDLAWKIKVSLSEDLDNSELRMLAEATARAMFNVFTSVVAESNDVMLAVTFLEDFSIKLD